MNVSQVIGATYERSEARLSFQLAIRQYNIAATRKTLLYKNSSIDKLTLNAFVAKGANAKGAVLV